MREISEMFDDPEPLDDNDPEVIEDTFITLFEMETKPEELPDLKDRKEYAAWLKNRKK